MLQNLLRVFTCILFALIVASCGFTNSSTPSSQEISILQESKERSTSSETQDSVIKVPVNLTEKFIESSLLEKAGAVTKVTCPETMEGQIGDFFKCLVENLTIPSDSHFADVQIMNELGEISYVVRRD